MSLESAAMPESVTLADIEAAGLVVRATGEVTELVLHAVLKLDGKLLICKNLASSSET